MSLITLYVWQYLDGLEASGAAILHHKLHKTGKKEETDVMCYRFAIAV